MYSKSLMPQSCSLGGAKAAAGQPALGKQVTGAGAEGQVPCPAQPVAPPAPLLASMKPRSQQSALQEMSLRLQEGPPGPAQAVPVPLHGGWPEDADFPTTLACAWSVSGATWMQARYQSFETQGLHGV